MEFTKRFKLKCNTPKINKLKIKPISVIYEGCNSEDILIYEDLAKALKHRKKVSMF